MPTYQETTLEGIEFEQPRLRVSGLPLLIDDWTLAFRMGFTGKALWYVLKDVCKQYKVFKIKKASGGLRTIHNPSTVMRIMAKQLRARILLPIVKTLGPHVGAYREGKAAADSARHHLADCATCKALEVPHTCKVGVEGREGGYSVKREGCAECPACQPLPKHACTRRGVKVHLDLKDFFGSTRRAWIRQYFHEVVGYNHYVSGLLGQLMTVRLEGKHRGQHHWGVPQGAPFSGDICNLVADWRLDSPLLKELQGSGWTYSRYADDLYFSHPENLKREKVDDLLQRVERVVQGAGYRLNKKKLHVQRPHKRQKLLGVVLNQKVNIPREDYRRVRALLNNCLVEGFGPVSQRLKYDTPQAFQAWLMGKVSYFRSLNPHKADLLTNMYLLAKNKHTDPLESYEFVEGKRVTA